MLVPPRQKVEVEGRIGQGVQQLLPARLTGGCKACFGPTKTGKVSTIAISTNVAALLRSGGGCGDSSRSAFVAFASS